MKRIFALLLTMVLVFGMTAPVMVFAEDNYYNNEDGYTDENRYEADDYNGEDEILKNGPSVWEMFERPFPGYDARSMFGYVNDVKQADCGNYTVEIRGEDGETALILWMLPILNTAVVDARTGMSADINDHGGGKVYVIYGPLYTHHDVPQSNALVIAINAGDIIEGTLRLFTIEAIEPANGYSYDINNDYNNGYNNGYNNEYSYGYNEGNEYTYNNEYTDVQVIDNGYNGEYGNNNGYNGEYGNNNGYVFDNIYYNDNAYENGHSAEYPPEYDNSYEYVGPIPVVLARLTVDNGGLIIDVTDQTHLQPYLTRENLQVDALTVGDEILVWTMPMFALSYPAQTTAVRVVRVVRAAADVYDEQPATYEPEDEYTEKPGVAELVNGMVYAGVNLYPVRVNAYARGFEVHWNKELFRAELTLGDIFVTVVPGSAIFYVNGEPYALTSPTFMENGTLFAPLEFFEKIQ